MLIVLIIKTCSNINFKLYLLSPLYLAILFCEALYNYDHSDYCVNFICIMLHLVCARVLVNGVVPPVGR